MALMAAYQNQSPSRRIQRTGNDLYRNRRRWLGMDGTDTCQIHASNTQVDASIYDLLPCIDTDGDGWGWKEPPDRPEPGQSCVVVQ